MEVGSILTTSVESTATDVVVTTLVARPGTSSVEVSVEEDAGTLLEATSDAGLSGKTVLLPSLVVIIGTGERTGLTASVLSVLLSTVVV